MKRFFAMLSMAVLFSTVAWSQVPAPTKAKIEVACADCCKGICADCCKGDCDSCCKGHCNGDCPMGSCDHCK